MVYVVFKCNDFPVAVFTEEGAAIDFVNKHGWKYYDYSAFDLDAETH